jgi:hypothetical protein
VFSLEYASAGTIVDDERSWPKRGNLFLNGFIYEQISPPGYVRSAVLSPQDVETRLKWLNLQPERPFNPQPYLQLAKVLRGIGNYAGATTVLEEMERRRRHLEDHTPTDRIASWVFRESIGYGHDPLRAIWMILGLSVIGWVLYRRGYLAGNMVPSDEEAYESFKSEGRPPRHYRAFAPLVYSLENSLPLVKLGLADQWQPDPSSKDQLSRKRNWIATFRDQLTWPRQLSWVHRLLVFCGLQPHANLENPPSRFSRFATSPRFLRWFLWIQILLGWLLATLFLAGVTGIVRSQ